MRKFFGNKGKAAALGKCRIVLAAAAAGLLVYLLAAPNPWTTDDQVKIWGWLGGLAAFAGIRIFMIRAWSSCRHPPVSPNSCPIAREIKSPFTST